MLVITGPGRSGTSVLARFLREMGLDPGGSWYDAVDAGLEDERVVRINDDILRPLKPGRRSAADWTDYRAPMAAIDRAVVKDPRFSFHPDVLRAWQGARHDLAVLYTYRTPELCLRSRNRVPGMLRAGPHMRTPADVRRNLADAVETMLELAIPFRILLFPGFLDRFDDVCEALQGLGVPLDRRAASAAWVRVVDRRKMHFPPEPPAAAPRGFWPRCSPAR